MIRPESVADPVNPVTIALEVREMIEKIIAKKEDGDFLNYIIIEKTGNSLNNLSLFVEAIRSSFFQDILNYEIRDLKSFLAVLLGSSLTYLVVKAGT